MRLVQICAKALSIMRREMPRSMGVILPLRLAAGLDGISPEECDTVTIAGMGGQTIAEILQNAPWTADGKSLLLFSQ